MGTYVPLLNVFVSHAYFNDSMWPGLDFVANAETAKLIDGAGLVVKTIPSGIQVVGDLDKSQALRSYGADSGGQVRLSFKVFIKDRAFANYTRLPNIDSRSALIFEKHEANGSQIGGPVRISKNEFASDSDVVSITELIARGILHLPDCTPLPNFFISVSIDIPPQGIAACQEFHLGFEARQSYWKYFLLGAMNKENLFIADTDNAVEFAPCGNQTVYGNKEASVFRSKGMLPILERSPYRFQLKERGFGGSKVLIKRLPVASGKLSLEVVDGETVLVANNYINY